VEIHAPAWLRDLEEKTEPIVLENVRTSELDALLCIMYPTYVCFASPTSLRLNVFRSDVCRRDVSSATDWASVLRLATRWHFPSFRTLALKTLEPIASPIQKLFLARELDVMDWLLPSLVALCLREESLTLSEMRSLSLEDVHLIVTVRECVHTSKVAATVKDVSEHVQPLIAASVEPFTPKKAGGDIMNPSSDEPMSASTLSPPPELPATAPVAAAIETETIVEANHAPVELAFDPQAMRKALEDVAYDRAVASISPGNGEEASRVIVKWVSDSCSAWCAKWYPLRELVYAFANRCAREVSFSSTAADVLSRCKSSEEPQGKLFYASRSTHGDLGNHLQSVFSKVVTFILRAPYIQSSCNPSTFPGKILYGRMERWLNDADFASRLDNCATFIGEALMTGLISKREITEALKCVTGQALYRSLLVLGHQLESCPEDLDALFKELDAYCNNARHPVSGLVTSESVEEHRKWLTVSIHTSLSVKISNIVLKHAAENTDSARTGLGAGGLECSLASASN
jgi:hypothetical protein